MSKWTRLRDRAIDWIAEKLGLYDLLRDTGEGAGILVCPAPADGGGVSDYPSPDRPETPAPLHSLPLGIASCWHGANAAERMMNVLSTKMPDSVFGRRLAFMIGKGCTVAHVFLANQGDGEYAGYAAWDDGDREKMLKRWETIRDAGLALVPWIVADDSPDYRARLFADADRLVGRMATFLASPPYVVLGLEMDEGKTTADQWKKVREAVRKYYRGPIGVHHMSGNDFKFAALGDIVLGQLSPGCTEAQVKAQIKAIRARDKRAVGFEYSRGPDRKLCLAAIDAGAEGVGNWDGGAVPGATVSAAEASSNRAVNGLGSPGLKKRPAAGADGADAVEYSSLEWRWGNFKGGKAVLSGARIKDLKVGSDSLSYKWEGGSCSDLDPACTHDNPCCTCALFCRVGGKWVGGKFEHISSDRTTRGLGNVAKEYGGWDPSFLSKADAFAFVILDDGAKRRTNVVSCGR